MLLELPSSRQPVEPPQSADAASAESPEPTDIDLERAAWDPEYRRQALTILRRTGQPNDAAPAQPPAARESTKKQP